MMTPEERATEIVDSMIRHRASVNTNNEALRVEIASAIRAAENDALERAVASIEGLLHEDEATAHPDSVMSGYAVGGYRSALRGAAEAVSGLKHK